MGVTYNNTSVVADNLLYSLDFANVKNYVGSGSATADSMASRGATLNNSSYYSYDAVTRSMNFTRDVSTLVGGNCLFTGTGSLTATNFLYRDHTMEVLARVNDLAPGNYNVNETSSVLVGYQGYHSGFSYDTGSLIYSLWNGTGFNALTVSTSYIPAGAWVHLVLTRLNNTNTLYVNGTSVATSTHAMTGGNPGVTDNFRMAAGNAGVGPFAYYAKCNIAVVRLYSKALSLAEVQQNFNAVRGRYGL